MNQIGNLDEIFAGYEAADGLHSLEKDSFREGFREDLPQTTKSENGILYRAECILQASLNGINIDEHKERSLRAIRLCQDFFAITHRRPGQINMPNSHDNKVGELVLLQCHGQWSTIRIWKNQLVQKHWSYNNVKPYAFSFETFLLPRDQALFRMAAGDAIGVLSFIWLWFSIYTKSKHKRMNRLRLYSLKMSYARHNNFLCGLLMKRFQKWWDKIGGDKWFAEDMKNYYQDPTCPYRLLVESSQSDH